MKLAAASIAVLALVAEPGATRTAGAPLAPVQVTEWTVPWKDSRPRDPYVDSEGRVWFVGQVGNYLAHLDPKSGRFERFDLPAKALPHNLVVDAGGDVWYAGNGDAHMVRIARGQREAPRLAALLADPGTLKIFHFARFDLAALKAGLGVMPAPVYCTKIASKLSRTFTDKHGLKDLVKDLLGVEVSKQQQSSDWGAGELTDEQLRYAATDVVHLHEVRKKLDAMLVREGRAEIAAACMSFLPVRALLDLGGWAEEDIFAH